MTKKIGFACKFIPVDGQDVAKLNATSTTVAWLKRQSVQIAEEKLMKIAMHNCDAYMNVFDIMKTWPCELRQIRLGSELIPMYSEPTWGYFWQLPEVKKEISKKLNELGNMARLHDIRLSFHPGQFCCLASNREDVVTRSLAEFEYHTDVAVMMGYGTMWHDHGFKINIHISGKQGVDGMIKNMKKLSEPARNLISIENDEISWGVDDILKLHKISALVLDIHHHFVKTSQYMGASDDRVKIIIDSWRGIRPVLHYSQPKKEVMKNNALKRNVMKLRAHSDMLWDRDVNKYVLDGFWENFDIMCEAKMKNLAQHDLYYQAINNNNIGNMINEDFTIK